MTKTTSSNSNDTATLYDYATSEELRELTSQETVAYLMEIALDDTGTGAVDGAAYGYPGQTVYAV